MANFPENLRETLVWVAERPNNRLRLPGLHLKTTMTTDRLEWLNENAIPFDAFRLGPVVLVEIPDDNHALHYKLRWFEGS